jgi:hypothetical protein
MNIQNDLKSENRQIIKLFKKALQKPVIHYLLGWRGVRDLNPRGP